MNTQYRKNLKAVLEASKSYCDESINNLKWELGTYDLSVDSDSNVAYQKTIPSGTIDCMINKFGGMSYKSENLIVLNDVVETTTSGITYSVKDGVITLNGTTSETAWISLNLINELPKGNYVFNAFNPTTNNSILTWFRNINNEDYSYKYLTEVNSITTITDNSIKVFRFNIATGTTLNNFKIIPMIVRGTTAPSEYKEAFEGIRDTAVSSVVSKNANDETIDTLTIDSNIQALNGYGWGINDNCYNYIYYDVIRGKWFYIQKVARVDLDSLNWVYDEGQSRFYFIDNTNILGAKFPVQSQTINNIKIAKDYTNVSYQSIYTEPYTDKVIAGANITNVNYLSIRDNTYTTAEAFKTAMSGVYLYYELATPVETDISEYIDNNFIEVEENGTITFNNTYEQSVPSNVDYLIEEVKA